MIVSNINIYVDCVELSSMPLWKLNRPGGSTFTQGLKVCKNDASSSFTDKSKIKSMPENRRETFTMCRINKVCFIINTFYSVQDTPS